MEELELDTCVIYADVAAEEYAEAEILSQAETLKFLNRMEDHTPKLGHQNTQHLQGQSIN
jgi:hypothetical protein